MSFTQETKNVDGTLLIAAWNVAVKINVLSDFLQKLLSQNYWSYNDEKSIKWKQIDIRNIHFYCIFLVSVVFVW